MLENRKLQDYCQEPTSSCDRAGFNCDNCPEKERAEQRRKEGKKTLPEVIAVASQPHHSNQKPRNV